MTKSLERTNRLVLAAAFAAIAYLCMFLLPIKVSFLTLDMKDSVIAIGALYLGPVTGILISAVVALVEMVTVSQTGIYGFFMNFLGSAVFSATVSLFYTRQKSLKRALLGLICSIVAMTSVMLAFNLIVTPVYLGQPRQAIIDMILPLLLPFNLGKGILNAALTMLLYKPISIALGHTSFSQHVSSTAPKKKNTYIVAGCSILLIAAVLLYFFIKMGATV